MTFANGLLKLVCEGRQANFKKSSVVYNSVQKLS